MNMVFLPILALSVLAQPAGPDLSKKISIEIPAMPVDNAVRMIAEQSQTKLEVNPTAADAVVIVKVEDVTLKELLDRIAAVSSNEWRLDGETLRLTQNVTVRNKEVQDDRERRIKQIRTAIDRFRKRLADMNKPPKPPANAKPEEIEEAQIAMGFMGSSNKAVMQFALNLDVMTLAGLEDGDRIVFSSSPTRMQRPLNGNVAGIVGQAIIEHNNAVTKRKQEPEPDLGPEAEAMKPFMEMMGMNRSEKLVTEAPEKVLLVASRGGMFSAGIRLDLRVYNAKGEIVLTQSDTIFLSDSMLGGMFSDIDELEIEGSGPATSVSGTTTIKVAEPKKEETQPAKDPEPDGPIEYSPETREMQELFSSMGQGSFGRQPSDNLKEKMLHPDLYDPLRFGPTESVVALAKVRKLNVVANLPDEGMSLFRMFSNRGGKSGSGTVSAFVKSLATGGNVQYEAKDGWATIKPSRPIATRKDRVNRVDLAKLLQAVQSKGGMRLDDLAAFAQRNDSPMELPAATMYFMYFAPNAINSGMRGPMNWNLVRFYGTMGPAQRANMSEGTRIPFGMLSPGQMNLVRKMAFGADAKLQVERASTAPSKEEPFWMEMVRQFGPTVQTDFRDEPTEVMPDGLPGNGYLNLKVDDEPIAQPHSDKGAISMFGVLGADELAMLRYFTEDPKFAQMVGELPQIAGVRLGQRTIFNFTFHYVPGVTSRGSLQDDQLPRDGALVAMDKLPDAVNARIQKRLDQMKKFPFPMFPNFTPPQAPPQQ